MKIILFLNSENYVQSRGTNLRVLTSKWLQILYVQDVLLQVRVPDQEMRRILSASEEQEMGMIALDFQIFP